MAKSASRDTNKAVKKINVDIRVPNELQYVALIGSIGEDIARNLAEFRGDRNALASQLNLVLTEASANAMEHADVGAPEKFVRVCIRIKNDCLEAKVYDTGQGFDINRVPQPDFDHPTERGRGIFFIKTLMDTVTYRHVGTGNVLRMVKYLK